MRLTPMNGIMGMIDLANRYPTDLEVQQKCRDKIMESSQFLVSLVNDILDITKLESGELINQEMSFDLTEQLNRVNTSKQILDAEKNVEYIVDWEKGDIKNIHLVGNPIYLERLLNAVSDNAVKFTNPGGCVRVWCIEKSADSDLDITLDDDGGITFSNSAASLDGVDVGRLFDRLFTVEAARSSTGLGLSIARSLVEKMNGSMSAGYSDNVLSIRIWLPEEKK